METEIIDGGGVEIVTIKEMMVLMLMLMMMVDEEIRERIDEKRRQKTS